MPHNRRLGHTLFPIIYALIMIAAAVRLMPACLASESANSGYGVSGLAKESSVDKEQEWALNSGKAYTAGQMPQATLDFSLPVDGHKDWQNIARGRHPYLAFILNAMREPVCGGIIVRGNYVLTAYHCIWVVGSNALVALGATGTYENGTVMAEKIVRAEETHYHPSHPLEGTDSTEVADLKSVDIALLKVNVEGVLTSDDIAPTADPEYNGVFNSALVFAFRLEPRNDAKRRSIQVASFFVGDKDPCHTMSEPGPHTMCLTSSFASMPRGSSGFPVLYMDLGASPDKALSEPLQFGTPNTDLILGVVSFDIDK
ncbi:unnamed protein product, partial [Ostreobium quekettii]